MKKNGFTLVELLITLSLIVVIGLIIANNIAALSNRQSDNEYNDFKKHIEKAACIYAGLDKNKASCGSTNCVVTIGTLIAEGLLDDNLINPKTEEEVGINQSVYAQYDNGKRTCYFSEDNSTYDFIGPSVTITKHYGLVEIQVTDTSYLGAYDVNTSPKNVTNATSFGNVSTKTVYFEPRMIGTYYVHAYDRFNNFAIVSASNPVHPSFLIRENDVDTTSPVITINSISRGVIKASIYDDLKVKGYAITSDSAEPRSYTLLYNKQLETADIAVGGETKEVTLDPIIDPGVYYLHAIDYYNNKTNYRVELDFTKPTVSYTTNGTSVTLTFSDNIGLKKYFITKLSTLPQDAEWTNLSSQATTITVNKTINETGNYYVYLYDIQDNLTSEAIYVDLDAPVVTYQISGSTVTYTITDNGTLKGYVVNTSSATPSSYTTISGKEFSGSFQKTGSSNYYIHVVDENNNVANIHVT